MADFWRLPSDIVESISRHHDDPDSMSSDDDMIRVLRLSVMIVSFLEQNESSAITDIRDIESRAFDWFGLDRERLVQLIESIVDDAADMANALKIDAGRMPPVEAILHRARRMIEEIPGHEQIQIDNSWIRSIPSQVFLKRRPGLDLESCFRTTRCSNGDLDPPTSPPAHGHR